jgi:hypothetical protein
VLSGGDWKTIFPSSRIFKKKYLFLVLLLFVILAEMIKNIQVFYISIDF